MSREEQPDVPPGIDWDDLLDIERPETRAAFDSDCPGCGVRIHEGDVIVLDDGDWVCEDCA